MSDVDSRTALQRLGLTEKEIDAYFAIVGKGVCLASEIAIKAEVPEEQGQSIADKLVAQGLLKEIPGRTIRYQALPPYSALLKQLEEFRDYITDLRQSVPKQLSDEFDKFEKGFARVSGLGDFKKFVVSVQEDIPKAMIERLEQFADKFQSFEQLEEFKTYIQQLKQSAPQELSAKFEALEGQFDKLAKMDQFRNFVAQIKEKATSELTERFAKIETDFSEMKKLDEITSRFQQIREQVPDQLRNSFSSFQQEFQKVAGLEGFTEYVGSVKSALPNKIEMEFAQIEKQFSQLKQLQDFAAFVDKVSTEVPQQTLKEFEKFESEFRRVSGLEEFKLFMEDLQKNVPRELESQFDEFEEVLKGIKGELLNTNQELFGNWQKIFGDIFEEFINAFVQDIVSDQLEKIKRIFERKVVDGVQQILTKVMARTDTMSEDVMKSFDNLRQWMVDEVIDGLQRTLQSVNAKVDEASRGVTQGFAQLKSWITTQVTSDLEQTLSEVQDGAKNASAEVLERISGLQQWFDDTVVNQLTTILQGMEVKLQKAVQEAQTELSNVRGWFIKDAIAGISDTLDATQESVEQVSVEVNNALSKLKDWFAGEAISQLGVALNEVEERVSVASTEVVEGFDEMRNWVADDVVKTISTTLADVTSKVTTAADAIAEEVANLREMFSSRVVNNTFNMLSGIEDRLWESEATMKAFWDKAMAEISFRFQEVWFVQGPDAMVGEIAQVCSRAKSKIYIVAPELVDVDVIPLRLLPSSINVRIAAQIDPGSDEAIAILEEFIDKTNFRFRHYTGQNIWGVSKDFEEIILGAVSQDDVAGIGSIIDEHIKNFNPVLEHAWMEGKQVKSVEDAKLLEVERKPKPIRRKRPISVATSNPGAVQSADNSSVNKPSAQQKAVESVKDLGHQVISSEAKKAQTQRSNSMEEINREFTSTRTRMKADLEQKLGQLKENLQHLNKGTVADLIDELKEYTVQTYGFSRIVFEMSKAARKFTKKPEEKVSAEEEKYLNEQIARWLE